MDSRKRILITGAGGYVGSALYARFKTTHDVSGTYLNRRLFSELVMVDLKDEQAAGEYIRSFKPDVIIHAAARASVRWCEEHPAEAEEINVVATRHVVDAANDIGALVVFISSALARPDAGVYARAKHNAEEIVKGTARGFVILRPSLIIGMSPNTVSDRPFNRILKNLEHRRAACYDTSWHFQPTWLNHVVEVAGLVLERSIKNEIIPITVPEIKTRFDVARDILAPFGVLAEPEDQHDTTPTVVCDQDKLRALNLPVYSYAEALSGIIGEIREHENS